MPIAVGSGTLGAGQNRLHGSVSATLGPYWDANTLVSPDGLPDGSVPAGGPFSLSATGVLFSVDTNGFQSIAVQVTSPGTTCTITYETSNDGTIWVNQPGLDTTNVGGTAPGATSTSAALRAFPCEGRYFRARISAYGSGTVTVVPVLRNTPLPALGVNVGNGLIGISNVNGAATTGGLTPFHLKAAATTNATSVKGSAGRVYKALAYNASAAVKYLKFYNKATAPVVGTDTPILVFPLAVGANYLDFGDIGFSLSAGIGLALTGALADSDTTALAANDVILNLGYT